MSKFWIPSKEDYFKLRDKTTGLKEVFYDDDKGNKFCICDSGGSRGERGKWIQAFGRCQCIIFVIGLDHFCKCLFEDNSVNALVENMQIFKEMLENRYTKKMEFVLFFSQIDLFKECLKITDLSILYGDKYKFNFEAPNIIKSIQR